MNLDEQAYISLLENLAVPITDDNLDAEVLSFNSIFPHMIIHHCAVHEKNLD